MITLPDKRVDHRCVTGSQSTRCELHPTLQESAKCKLSQVLYPVLRNSEMECTIIASCQSWNYW